jgi:hypothetical protein
MTAAFFRISFASRNRLVFFSQPGQFLVPGPPVSGKGRQSALRPLPGLLHPPPQHVLVDTQIIGYLAYGFSPLFCVIYSILWQGYYNKN